ncbi:App1 family protein [Marinobacter fonticola]|uniref:App1 family protein n=1 Tax=Marinobacter fonticola TaxID=2603215 RepID=UPI0011E62BA1|nr:phosphatase domain-containing protein [Marinobacter fonticola]
MSLRRRYRQYVRSLRKGLHILAAPVKGDNGRGGLFIQAYRGFGSQSRLFLMGRVFHQPGFGARLREDMLRRDLIDLLRRLLRKPIVDAQVRVRYKDADTIVRTDRHGFFRVHMDLSTMPSDVIWHSMELSLVNPRDERATTTGEFFTPTSRARYGVISDIDDTVVYTGVANTMKMMWRLFAQGAESRAVFPGVSALYQAFYNGDSGAQGNPLFYVSRAPWSIYQVLVEFFRMHRIPNGPILILREWGMKRGSLMPRRAKDHKLDAIRQILALYKDMPFILIGDSGQRDPEVYTRVLQEHPGRILGIYIRDVSNDSRREEAIAELAREVKDAGSDLMLASDTMGMARHAVEQALIPASALDEVRRTHDREDDD